jgi:transposase InsO family protein
VDKGVDKQEFGQKRCCPRMGLLRARQNALDSEETEERSVKLQHSTSLSPWENGRIERFFGTSKNAISTALVPTMSVHAQLQWFRNYYNHIRTGLFRARQNALDSAETDERSGDKPEKLR